MELPKVFFCAACGNLDASLRAFLEDLGKLVSVMKRNVIKTLLKQIIQTK